MIGVVIPAHNEERHIVACLSSILLAASHPDLNQQPVCIVVVLDDCSDDTARLIGGMPVAIHPVCFLNVGKARASGAQALLSKGVQWLAFTDADTVVPADWLVRQLEWGADAVCGTVEVEHWGAHGERVRSMYLERYRFVENHRHIHGANIGLTASAYRSVGGFRPLAAHEDVHLVADLERVGARIVWTAKNPVITSARTDYKCRGGFGEYLISLGTALGLPALVPPASIDAVP